MEDYMDYESTESFTELPEQLELTGEVIGEPEQDMENWHLQESDYSCAVACQEFVAEQLLEQEFSEQELAEYSQENGWYDPETGTTLSDVGNILESLGLEVTREQNVTIQGIAEALDNGEKVICGVHNMILQNPEFAELPGITANHAVELIGLDTSDENHIKVILNDSGTENGMGVEYDLDTFVKAWDTSSRFVVFADKKEAA